jgi:hypothetical protein
MGKILKQSFTPKLSLDRLTSAWKKKSSAAEKSDKIQIVSDP